MIWYDHSHVGVRHCDAVFSVRPPAILLLTDHRAIILIYPPRYEDCGPCVRVTAEVVTSRDIVSFKTETNTTAIEV